MDKNKKKKDEKFRKSLCGQFCKVIWPILHTHNIKWKNDFFCLFIVNITKRNCVSSHKKIASWRFFLKQLLACYIQQQNRKRTFHKSSIFSNCDFFTWPTSECGDSYSLFGPSFWFWGRLRYAYTLNTNKREAKLVVTLASGRKIIVKAKLSNRSRPDETFPFPKLSMTSHFG